MGLPFLCTGDESLEDVIAEARASGIEIGRESIATDLAVIAGGGVLFLRATLLTDIRSIRTADWFAARGLDDGSIARLFRAATWFTWRAYRAAMRETEKARAVG